MQGWLNASLNESGRFLSAETGRALKNVHFDECISSPLARARETAEILLRESGNEDTPLTFDDRIKEISFGTSEGKKMDEADLPPEEARKFFTDPFNFRGFPKGETIASLRRRSSEFLREVESRDYENVLISCHGGIMRALTGYMMDKPNGICWRPKPHNCEIRVFSSENGRHTYLETIKVK